MKTVGFATLGCRLNQVESQEMRALVESAGYRAVEDGEAAQVYVVNTCTVTSRADFSDRQAIRRITRANAARVAKGLHLQIDATQLGELPASRDAEPTSSNSSITSSGKKQEMS